MCAVPPTPRILALKVILVTFGTVRARLVCDNITFVGRSHGNPEDAGGIVAAMLKMLRVMWFVPESQAAPAAGGAAPLGDGLLAEQAQAGPANDADAATDSLERWLAVHRNSAEQEPYFMCTALAVLILMPAANGANDGKIAANVVYFATACRVLHAISYIGKLQPWRTIFFIGGVGGTGILAVHLGILANRIG